jgi:hypothetical protein
MTPHTSWCDPNDCVTPRNDETMHRLKFGSHCGIGLELTQFQDSAAKLGVVGEADMTLPQLDEFIKALVVVRERLAQVH